MKTLVLGYHDVRKLLPMKDCIAVVGEAMQTLARGEAVLPLRQALRLPSKKGLLGMMPAFLDGDPQVLGIKVVSVFPGNHGTKYDSHQGAIQLFETANGRLLAIVDAGSITAIRTAAASGVASNLLAKKDIRRLTILGSGTQAGEHLEAMLSVRDSIEEVRIWSRDYGNALKFVKNKASKVVGSEVRMTAFLNPEDAVRGSELICTVTAAKSPILKGSWLSEGAHINAVGASVPGFRELDSEAVAKGELYVDRRQSAIEEADDFRIPKSEGLIDDSHIKGEIGELLIGKINGRTSEKEITIFKSLGLAIEDLAAAQRVYAQAVAQNVGTWVELVGEREGHDAGEQV